MLGEKSLLLGLNIQSFICHHDDLIVELEKFDENPKIIALTETWLTKIDTELVKQSNRCRSKLKKTIALVITTRCYQYPRILAEKEEAWVFIYTNL